MLEHGNLNAIVSSVSVYIRSGRKVLYSRYADKNWYNVYMSETTNGGSNETIKIEHVSDKGRDSSDRDPSVSLIVKTSHKTTYRQIPNHTNNSATTVILHGGSLSITPIEMILNFTNETVYSYSHHGVPTAHPPITENSERVNLATLGETSNNVSGKIFIYTVYKILTPSAMNYNADIEENSNYLEDILSKYNCEDDDNLDERIRVIKYANEGYHKLRELRISDETKDDFLIVATVGCLNSKTLKRDNGIYTLSLSDKKIILTNKLNPNIERYNLIGHSLELDDTLKTLFNNTKSMYIIDRNGICDKKFYKDIDGEIREVKRYVPTESEEKLKDGLYIIRVSNTGVWELITEIGLNEISTLPYIYNSVEAAEHSNDVVGANKRIHQELQINADIEKIKLESKTREQEYLLSIKKLEAENKRLALVANEHSAKAISSLEQLEIANKTAELQLRIKEINAEYERESLRRKDYYDNIKANRDNIRDESSLNKSILADSFKIAAGVITGGALVFAAIAKSK